MTATLLRPTPSPRDRQKQALELAAVLLLLERRNRRGLHAALRLPLSLQTFGGGAAHIESGIRLTGRTAILRLRAGTQDATKALWEKHAALTGTPAKAPRWVEDARATRTANALADAWRKRLDEAYQADLTGDKAARAAFRALDPNVERVASTETAQAFNDEIVRQNSYAYSLGYVVTETWDAMLDACERCSAMDRETVTRPERFVEEPPAHPRCRCVLVTDIESRDAYAA